MLNEIKERLKDGIVDFTYSKKDGSTRTAKGTTNVSIVSEYNATPIGGNAVVNDNVTRYFDINANGWRSFINDNLISID